MFKMKNFHVFFLLVIHPLANFAAEKLVWSDEFNNASLDYSKWGVEENAYGGGNNEQQICRWDKKNLRVENGNLVIEAHHDNPNVVGTIRPYPNKASWRLEILPSRCTGKVTYWKRYLACYMDASH